MKTVFAAWMMWLSNMGVDDKVHLQPPATKDDLAALEKVVGKSLPEDLRALYLESNGQSNWFKIEPSEDKYAVALFGSYEFLTIKSAIREYESWQQIRNDSGDNFHMDYNEGVITVRNGDPVDAEYWQPGWLPFAHDGSGNFYGVDLSPPENGTYGQIIIFGADEDERRVLASSVSEFMAQRMTKPGELELWEAPRAVFDMEVADQPAPAESGTGGDKQPQSAGFFGRLKALFS